MVRGTFSPARAWRPAVVARLARTLGSALHAMPHSSKVSACRRELNTSSAAEPRIAKDLAQRRASLASAESALKLGTRCNVGSENLQAQRAQSPAVKKHKDWSPPCSTAAPSCVGGRTVALSPTNPNKTSPRQLGGQRQGSTGAALPNPSLKLSPNGGPRGPGRRYPVHSRQPGPRVPPLVPT